MDFDRLEELISLDGKTAVITGAFRQDGIGLSVAKALAARGAAIFLTDQPRYAGEKDVVLNELKEFGANVSGIVAQSSDVAQANMVADSAVQAFGAIDILVTTSPLYCGYNLISQTPEKDWQQSYQEDILGTSEICRAVIPHIAERKGGSVVNQLTVWGSDAAEGLANYGISQSFMLGLSRTLATEHGGQGIRVNAVLAGYIDTPEFEECISDNAKTKRISAKEARETMEESCAIKRFGRPEEIAAVIAFLTSEAAGYISGVTLRADGGLMNAALHF